MWVKECDWKNADGNGGLKILNGNVRMHDKILMRGMSWLQSIQFSILERSGISIKRIRLSQ